MNNLKKIKIDICIPFYNFKSNDRYFITELVFKHFVNVREKFKQVSDITFTLVGSENEISKNLALKYFNHENDLYYEFYQEEVNNQEQIYDILTNKFRKSFELSIEKKPNISLLCGSNDIIIFDYFEQIINFYNKDKKQIFGINNYNNGNNFVFITKKISSFLEQKDYFIWKGNYKEISRNKYQYCGGIIGFNDFLYLNHIDLILNEIICFDEGIIEQKLLQLENIDNFKSNNIFYFNIKTPNKKEVTNFNDLIDFLVGSNLKLNDLSDKILNKLNLELSYIINLYYSFDKILIFEEENNEEKKEGKEENNIKIIYNMKLKLKSKELKLHLKNRKLK